MQDVVDMSIGFSSLNNPRGNQINGNIDKIFFKLRFNVFLDLNQDYDSDCNKHSSVSIKVSLTITMNGTTFKK